MPLRHRQIFLNSVNIVLCGDANTFYGAAIAWGTKVEKDHAMVSLPSHAEVTRCIMASETFTVSVLSAAQSKIARQYGGRKQSNPLAINRQDLRFTHWPVPVVRDACAMILCRVKQSISLNAQQILIAEIADIEAREDLQPLDYNHDAFFAAEP